MNTFHAPRAQGARSRPVPLAAALSVLLLLAGFVGLSGCSALPGQTVALRPEVKVPTGNVGKGKAVAFKVVDARADTIVGYRDAARTAPIKVEGDLSQTVGQAAARILTGLGFAPAPWKDGAPVSLVITINDLSYSAQALTVTRKVSARCVLSAKIVNGPGHWQGSFPVSQERERVTAPDENDNARFINDVLSESLTLMLSDPELVQYLGRDTPQSGRPSQ